MRYVYQGQTYGTDAKITVDGINYILRRLSPEKREALGVTIAPEPPTYDSRYQKSTGDEIVDLTWDELKPKLLTYAAAKRYERECAGVMATVDGEEVPVSTARGDDRTALHVTFSAIVSGLRADPSTFKFSDGSIRQASNAGMQAAIMAALAHVQAAFDLEAAVAADIEGEKITTYEAVDEAFT